MLLMYAKFCNFETLLQLEMLKVDIIWKVAYVHQLRFLHITNMYILQS